MPSCAAHSIIDWRAGTVTLRHIVRKTIRQAYARAGLPYTRAHLLHHTMVNRLLAGGASLKEVADVLRVVDACGPDVFTLKELVQLAAQLSGIRKGRGRPVISLPLWLGRLQARLMELAPGEPLMSRDNLDSMQRDNVASGTLPGLQSLGIAPAALRPIAAEYLKRK